MITKQQIKKDYQDKFSALRKLLHSWDLIPESPKDEFDDLSHTILSHLYKGADCEKINRILKSELSVTYGLFNDEFNAEEMALEIMEWWKQTEKLSDFF